MKVISKSQAETKKFAEDFLNSLKPQAGATVLALSGDLGSGKTTFSQYIGQALGVESHMPSPTFLIERVYELKDKSWQHLIHVDAYRLENSKELLALGWAEMLKSPKNLVLIEWAERVKNILPTDAIHIVFNHVAENTENQREISLT